jgi:hypothetical protein
MNLREAAQQALEALEQIRTPLRINTALDAYDVSRAISALRTALAESEQEPVAWKDTTYGNLHHQNFGGCIPLYTHPVPQPVELTDDDLEDIAIAARKGNLTDLRNAIERAQGIGGEA